MKDLIGILNGIDTKVWNPGTDQYLSQTYNRRSLELKAHNKTALQKELKLNIDATIPMIGMVSRLVEQKGLDIILKALPQLLKTHCQIVILGTGDTHFELQLSEWAEKQAKRFKVIIGYHEALAHRIEAGSDLFMMPSRFEPCGLNQLYSLKYATLPIVTAVGGLADTVIDAGQIKATVKELKKTKANGFILKHHSHSALIECVKNALSFYQQTEKWRQLQLNAMACQHSWQESAEQYIKIYDALTKKETPT